MPRLRLRLLLALLALPLGAPAVVAQGTAPAPASATVAQPATTTIILVRHGEKAAVPGNDPPLSAAGEARSLALLETVRRAGVQAVVTTQLQRTRLTAAPTTRELGLTREEVPAGGDVAAHARAVAEHVQSRHAGKTVLVVGHSNTLPAIITALGAGPMPEIDESVYDDYFVVIRPAAGPARLLHARYGAAR